MGWVYQFLTVWLLADPDMDEGVRARLCVVQGLAKFFTGNFCTISLYISVVWRAFLILYPHGFVSQGRYNLLLFQQLFWLVTISSVLMAQSAAIGRVLRADFTFQGVLGDHPQHLT